MLPFSPKLNLGILAGIGILQFSGVHTALAVDFCDFTVRGTISVDIDSRLTLLHALQARPPLAGLKVKVSARRQKLGGGWSLFETWGETSTDSNGGFEITKWRRCGSVHEFKIEVQMKSDTLLVADPGPIGVPWYQVSLSTAQDVNLVFSPGQPDALGDPVAQARAQLWILGRMIRKAMDDLGFGFGPQPLKIHYPTLEPTHAGPLTNVVFIHASKKPHDDDLFDGSGESREDMVTHESMHIWAYRHTALLRGGEGELTLGDLVDADKLRGIGTHNHREFVGTAFNEGFAEYAKDKLFEIMFNQPPQRPFNRTHLSCDLKLLSIDDLEHNDDGWISALHLLTTEELGTFDFGIAGSPPCAAPQQFVTPLAPPPTNCSNASIRFASILSAFLAHPELGLRSRLHLRDMRLNTFIERVTKVVGGFFKDKSSFYLDLANPASTTQPQAILCQ